LRADSQVRATYWKEGAPTDLGSLGAGSGACSQAFGNNAAGMIVGESCLAGYPWGTHAVRWRNPGVIDDYGTLGGTYGRALAINDSNVIVGASSGPSGDVHPVFIVNGKMIDVGVLSGTRDGQLTAVNAAGIAIGGCWSSSGVNRAVVATKDRLLELTNLVDGTPYAITSVSGIDDAGNLAATGIFQSQMRALILRPK
jgi:uncharacterized membrane protein